jgi:pyruvate, water dikinase
MEQQWLFWFDEIGTNDNDLVGKKCANLGELTRMGMKVPPGFALSLAAYEKFMNETEAAQEIQDYFKERGWRNRTLAEWAEVSLGLRRIVETQQMPLDMAQVITEQYYELQKKYGVPDLAVSVRSAGAVSRPGQYETHLNVLGPNSLLRNVIRVWSSSFNPRSLAFRAQYDLPIESDPIGVAILGMVKSRTAGVTLTANPNSGDDTKIVIEANWGLGESVVSGSVTPDYFILDKKSLNILEKRLGDKERCVSCSERGIAEECVTVDKGSEFCLSDEELKEIGKYGKLIEEHFKGIPQDIEWAVADEVIGENAIYFLQTRAAIIAEKRSDTDQILNLIMRR